MSLVEVMDLDFETAMALVKVAMRMEYLDKTEMAWTLMAAAQGSQKGMQGRVDGWLDIIKGPGHRVQRDRKAFFAMVQSKGGSL